MNAPAPILLVERREGVLLMTLNRPASRNALEPSIVGALTAALAELAEDSDLGAGVITGTDPAFCAGLDLRAYGDGTVDRAPVIDLLLSIPHQPKPVVAAVNGPAMTGGFELALACDWIVASSRALFADTHVVVGAFPGAGLTARLPAAVGLRMAKAMSLGGVRLDGSAALRAGLAVELTQPADLVDRAVAMAAYAAGLPRDGVAELRAAYDSSLGSSTAAALAAEASRREAWRAKGGTRLAAPPGVEIER